MPVDAASSTSAAAYPASAAPLRVAAVGLGWWGDQLAQAARRSGRVEVTACFARSEEARDSFARDHGCRAVADLGELLAAEDVDALVLATPHSTHLELIGAAAQAGKHVLVEKPLTVRHHEAVEAVRLARAAGIVLQVGHHRRKVAATRALRHRVDEGAFGQLHLVQAQMTTPSDLVPRRGWRGDPEECPLGGMTALGVHMVDSIQYLAGDIASVHAISHRVLGRGTLDDITTLSMELASGALATLSTSVVLARQTSVAVHGHEGSGWSERDGAELHLQRVDQDARERVDLEPVDALAWQMAEFADAADSGADPEVTGEVGAGVVAVLEAARISARDRRPVAVADVVAGAEAL
jgi:predicted dehydrogenase